jgi:gluconate 2-dehydrogenase gamma chain
MRRRDFVKTLGALPAAGATWADGSDGRASLDVPEARTTFSADQWRTLAAVQDHLLPGEPPGSGGGPGARDVRATAYLDRTLAVPGFDTEVRGFILKGIGWLDDLAAERHHAPFVTLAPGAREDLLREIAATGPGERWLASLITYTLEALLADPLYGGNPGGIGWTWLGHDPGLPRPTPATIHGRLGRG